MAQNVTIAGASYSNVPAIDVPKTGGGTARFLDTTQSTRPATAYDIRNLYVAYVNGSKVTGNASDATAVVLGTTLYLTDGFPVTISNGGGDVTI